MDFLERIIPSRVWRFFNSRHKFRGILERLQNDLVFQFLVLRIWENYIVGFIGKALGLKI